MPGLVGIVDKKKASKVLLENMINSIKHESWYKIDKFLKDRFALARVHLGILNPEPQPIFNEDKSLCIFMDGEIFDYGKDKEELKQKGHKFYVNNDPEFCLHLYEEYGEKFVEKLNGSFVIVIIDINNQKLLIANDRYGLRPLYYAKSNNKLLFASEVKAILQDKTFKKEINDEAIAEFFTFGQLLGNKTFFKGITVLPPASIVAWDRERFSIKQYWEFCYDETDRIYPEEYYVEKLVKLFKQAVERRIRGSHKISVSLSGGMDSRAVVAAIDREHPITTFTFTFPGIDESPEIAKRVSNKKGTIHKQFEIKQDYLVDYAEKAVYLTDGMLNLVHFHEISILDEIRKCSDIVFNGWGCENTIKGQFLNKKILLSKDDNELGKILFKKFMIVSERDRNLLFSQNYYNKIKYLAFKSLQKELGKSKNKHPANRSDYFVFQNRERRSIHIANSVYQRSKFECEEPFTDNDFVDFSLKIPPELRCDRRIYFKFLKKLSPELSKIPVSPAGVHINVPSIIYKIYSLKKAGMRKFRDIIRIKTRGLIKIPFKDDYPDYGEWIRSNERLKKWVERILLDERTLNRKYFNRNFIIKMVNDHMSYRKDYTQLIFILLTFELWHRMFMEGEKYEYTYC